MRIKLLPLLLALFVPVASGAQFTLRFTDNSTNETGFTVERSPGLDATTGFVVLANIVSSPAQTIATGEVSYIDAGLPNATPFTYRVCAYNDAGKSGYSNTASGTTPVALTSPTKPGLLQAPEKTPAYSPPLPGTPQP